MYNNISQILLQCKTWQYYSKFDFTKSLGVRYRCVKIPQCGYMEHGLKYIVFYIQTHTNTLHSCHNFPAGSRQAARGARICETSLLAEHIHGLVQVAKFEIFNILKPRQKFKKLRRWHFQMLFLEWMEMYGICLKFQGNLFQRFELTICQHWFR